MPVHSKSLPLVLIWIALFPKCCNFPHTALNACSAHPAKWDQLAWQHAVAVHDDVFDSPFTSTRSGGPSTHIQIHTIAPASTRDNQDMLVPSHTGGLWNSYTYRHSHTDMKNITIREEKWHSKGRWRGCVRKKKIQEGGWLNLDSHLWGRRQTDKQGERQGVKRRWRWKDGERWEAAGRKAELVENCPNRRSKEKDIYLIESEGAWTHVHSSCQADSKHEV